MSTFAHTFSPPCHVHLNTMGVTSVNLCLLQFSAAALMNWRSQWYICDVSRALFYSLCIRLILSRASHLKCCLNKVKMGCCSEKEIVLWKFRPGLFPSISYNCNLWKAKWRVAQNLAETPRGTSCCWQWFCQLWSMERSPPNLDLPLRIHCAVELELRQSGFVGCILVFVDNQSVLSVVCLQCCFSFFFFFFLP